MTTRLPRFTSVPGHVTGLLAAGGRTAVLALAVAAAGVVAQGCPTWVGQHPSAVDDSTFVATVAALRRAVSPGGAETSRDSAGRQAVRDSILRKYGVTAADLETAARQLAQRPDHAADILRAIDRKAQLAAPSNPPPGAPATPTGPNPALLGTPPPGLLVPPPDRTNAPPTPRTPAGTSRRPTPPSAGRPVP